MRERLFVALALGALLVASLPAVASADPYPVQPGRYELAKLQIGTYEHDYCYAIYAEAQGGDVDIGTDVEGYASVRIVENKRFIRAVCKAIDISGTWEKSAEVGYIDDQCILVRENEPLLDDGDGRMVVAANTGRCPGDEENCSNITMTCTFEK